MGRTPNGRSPETEGKRFLLVTLGCFRNEVVSDLARGFLYGWGLSETEDVRAADLILVNTCGFIGEACQEGIETVLELHEHACKHDPRTPILVFGCMAQRFGRSLADNMSEIDGLIGVDWTPVLKEAVTTLLSGGRFEGTPGPPVLRFPARTVSSSRNATLYVRIADGCNNRCTFCAIPRIKGPVTSKPMKRIREEIERLAGDSYREVVLLAQDLTSYGVDSNSGANLTEIIDGISDMENVRWIRLLYLQPESVNRELIDAVIDNPKVCNYFDIPFQHASAAVLERMGRWGGENEFRRLVELIRSRSSEAAIRTTVMVGFPGETDEDFMTLYDFVASLEFDWLGAFCFSPEEGAPAAGLGGRVDRDTTLSRYDRILELQDSVESLRTPTLLGRRMEVVVDEFCEQDGYSLVGRSFREAPIVDGAIFLRGPPEGIEPGSFVDVRIVGQEGLDLVGEIERPA